MKIDGKEIAKPILQDLKSKVEKLKKSNVIPHLAIIIAGDDPASIAYVNQKKLAVEKIGAKSTIVNLKDSTQESELIEIIEQFNEDQAVNGIIVQQPLPKDVRVEKITQSINPKKDVDGFHLESHFEMPINMSVLKILETVYLSIPNMDLRFLDWLKDKKTIIIGKGETGGKPIIQMFKAMKIPFEVIDTKTKNPQSLTKKADIIISAVGKKGILKSKAIKKGVVLIGIGISRGETAKLTGDYDQSEVENIASFYTPTPGGIGPINVAMLLKNLIIAIEEPL